ncbi:MAG: hypothetical protein WC192_02220 [Candidatus Babeliales bacterium]|jgi:hypothetical protein
MNKLVKIVSLTTILTSNFLLSAMERQTYATDIKMQTHILTKLYTGGTLQIGGNRIECKDNRIFVYSSRVHGINEDILRSTSFELLQQQGLVQEILVDTDAYELMTSKLSPNFRECNNISSGIDFKNSAKKLVSQFRDKTKLNEFITKILDCLNVRHPAYGSIFLLASIFISNKGRFILDDLTDASLFDELGRLNKEIYLLVNHLIQIKLQSVKPSDDPREPLLQRMKPEIDDSFVAAGVTVVARKLLSEINVLIKL